MKYNYHDASLVLAEYLPDDTICLAVDLCGVCSSMHGGGRVHLYFYGVKNFLEVNKALEAAGRRNPDSRYIDEILGLDKIRFGEYGLDLQYGGHIVIHTNRIVET